MFVPRFSFGKSCGGFSSSKTCPYGLGRRWNCTSVSGWSKIFHWNNTGDAGIGEKILAWHHFWWLVMAQNERLGVQLWGCLLGCPSHFIWVPSTSSSPTLVNRGQRKMSPNIWKVANYYNLSVTLLIKYLYECCDCEHDQILRAQCSYLTCLFFFFPWKSVPKIKWVS